MRDSQFADFLGVVDDQSCSPSKKKEAKTFTFTQRWSSPSRLYVFCFRSLSSNLNSFAQRCRTEIREEEPTKGEENNENVCQKNENPELEADCLQIDLCIRAIHLINFMNNASDTYFNFTIEIFRQFNFPNELSTSRRVSFCSVERYQKLHNRKKLFKVLKFSIVLWYGKWKWRLATATVQSALSIELNWEHFQLRVEIFFTIRERKTEFFASETIFFSLPASSYSAKHFKCNSDSIVFYHHQFYCTARLYIAHNICH